jgi:hypothetical protein
MVKFNTVPQLAQWGDRVAEVRNGTTGAYPEDVGVQFWIKKGTWDNHPVPEKKYCHDFNVNWL